jgi:hypothetical protein
MAIDLDIFSIYTGGMGTKKKKRGRPPKTTGVKSESFLLRMEPEERAGFAAAADLDGLPLSAWMRTRLRTMAAYELEQAGKPVPWRDAPQG